MSNTNQNTNSFGGIGGIENLLTLQIQNTIIKELIDYVKTINLSFNDSYSETFYKVASLIAFMLIVFLLKKILNSGADYNILINLIIYPLSSLWKLLFYKKISLILSKNSTKYKTYKYNNEELNDYILHRMLQEELFRIEITSYLDKSKYFDEDNKPITITKTHSGLPIYYYATKNRISDNIEVNYEFARFYHSSLINKIIKKSYDYEINTNLISGNKFSCIKIASSVNEYDGDMVYKTFKADKTYETNNLYNVGKVIKEYISISNTLDTYYPMTILINGKPGLGKTKIADYVSSNKLCNNAYLYDMTRFNTVDVSTIFSDICRETEELEGVTLILIDEIDKYLNYWINSEFELAKEKKIEKLMSIQEFKNNIDINVIIKDKDEHNKIMKAYFLFKLLHLIETKNTNSKRIFVFCSNNFWTLFENIDMTHFKSLKDRLIQIDFNKCSKTEIGDILRYYNSIYKSKLNHKYIDDQILNSLIDNIPEKCELSMRRLHHILTKSYYNLEQCIQNIEMYWNDKKK